MRIGTRAVMSILAMTVVGAFAPSCSNSTLESGSEGLVVTFAPNPSGTGRFDSASFNVNAVFFLPADPDAASVYGGRPLSLTFSPLVLDLTQTQSVAYSQIALAAGTYRVTQISFTSPQLIDTDPTPAPATCIDGVNAVPSGPAAGQVPPNVSFDSSAGFTFTVNPGQTTLAIFVNVPGLIAEFEDGFTCVPDCGGGQPCLTGFDTTNYPDVFLNNVSFN